MKSQYAEELKPGQIVKTEFLLSRKITKDKKDGGTYAVLEFTDRTGTIEGIAWDAGVNESLKRISYLEFVFVVGSVNEYNGRLQVVVNSINAVPEKDIDPGDFLPRTDEDINAVMAEITGLLDGIEHPALRQLAAVFRGDSELFSKFQRAPAAKRAHHAYIGGLAVHTRNVMRLVVSTAPVYGSVNSELLLLGALLHDIGKVDEYSYQKKLDITTKGRMFGHIVIGYELVSDMIRRVPDFPDDLRTKLLHMILSHHGEVDWGSPKPPVFPEALLLHFLDNLDSKIAMMIEEYHRNRGTEREWSDYHPFLSREIYLGEE